MIIAVIQARMGSTRLPGKCLKEVNNEPILYYIISSLRKANIDKIIVATTNKIADNLIEEYCKKIRVECFRGDEDDVLSRYVAIAKNNSNSQIIRITADDILIDSHIVDRVLAVHLKNNNDYTSNVLKRTYALGQEVEVIKGSVLINLDKITNNKEDREHVTLYIRKNTSKFKVENVKAPQSLRWPELRLCIDQEEDFLFIQELFKEMKIEKNNIPDYEQIVEFLKKANLTILNKGVKRKPINGKFY